MVSLVIKFHNNEGIISSILVAILLSIPSLILMPRVNKLTGYEDFGNTSSNGKRHTPKSNKITATTWDFGRYKETTYRDKNGNKTKIEHWKF